MHTHMLHRRSCARAHMHMHARAHTHTHTHTYTHTYLVPVTVVNSIDHLLEKVACFILRHEQSYTPAIQNKQRLRKSAATAVLESS